MSRKSRHQFEFHDVGKVNGFFHAASLSFQTREEGLLILGRKPRATPRPLVLPPFYASSAKVLQTCGLAIGGCACRQKSSTEDMLPGFRKLIELDQTILKVLPVVVESMQDSAPLKLAYQRTGIQDIR